MNTTASTAHAEEIAHQIANATESHGWGMNPELVEVLAEEIQLATSQGALDDFLTALARGIHDAR